MCRQNSPFLTPLQARMLRLAAWVSAIRVRHPLQCIAGAPLSPLVFAPSRCGEL